MHITSFNLFVKSQPAVYIILDLNTRNSIEIKEATRFVATQDDPRDDDGATGEGRITNNF